jgi:hypothetical protein
LLWVDAVVAAAANIFGLAIVPRADSAIAMPAMRPNANIPPIMKLRFIVRRSWCG